LRRADGEIGLAIKARMDEAARRARKNKRLLRLLLKLLRDPRSIKLKKRLLANTSAEILEILRLAQVKVAIVEPVPPTEFRLARLTSGVGGTGKHNVVARS
jgi:hypothetical protein